MSRSVVLCVCGLLASAVLLQAADVVWMANPANGVWSTSEPNWDGGVGWPNNMGHTAVFGDSTQRAITVGEALSLGAIRFTADGYRLTGDSLTFTGASPFIATEGAGVTSRLETAIHAETPLSKTGAGTLCLGAAAYAGETNVQDLAVAEGVLQIEEGRTLCLSGVQSVAAGAAYVQTGGTNLLLNGGDILVLGDGPTAQPASFEITGGVWHARATAISDGVNARMVLGREQDAWFRIADSADVWTVVIEMTELAAGRSATLQLDGGKLTLARMGGTGGANGTHSRLLLNGTELYPERSNSAFISGMTEALMQAGGLRVNIPGGKFYKTSQSFTHDPALGTTLDGGLTKIGAGDLYLQADSSYTGTNRIEQGKVFIAASNALGTGPVEMGMADYDAVLASEGGYQTVTNSITVGRRGSVAAAQGGTLELRHLALDTGGEQVKAGGYTGSGTGTVRLVLDPATTTKVFNVFVYDRNNLELDGGTVIEQIDSLPDNSRVEVRYGSRLRVADAVLNVPGLYLNVAGGEYLQEAGEAVFRFAHGTTNDANNVAPLEPVGIVLNDGSLTFTESPMFTPNTVRSTRTIINGGHLRAGQVNLSKSNRRDERLTHLLELNGGVLEADEIRYDGGILAVEPAILRLNGGTLKVAQTSTATNDFISINRVNLLSVYLGSGGFVCDTAGMNASIHQSLEADPLLGAIPDGGLRKLGAGCLTLTQPLISSGPVTVEQGSLRLAEAWFADKTIEVQDGGMLELGGGGISNAAIHVAAGGTLRLTEAAPEAEIINGSFEVYDAGQLTATVKHKYQPTGTGWTFSGNNTSGIQANGSGFSNHPDYHTTNGTVTAFVKQGTIQRDFNVPRDGTYRLSFEQATRNGYSSWARNVEVKIDGVKVYTITHGVELHGFLPVEITVSLTAGTHTLTFEGLPCSYNDATVLIDAVRLIGVPMLRFDDEVQSGQFAAVQAETPVAVTNGSFEIYAPDTFNEYGHNYIPKETGWIFSGNNTSGIQTNGSAFSDPTTYTTNGGVTAFIREGSIQTTFRVEHAGPHILSFEQATRNGFSSNTRNVEVRVDGMTVHTVTHDGYHGFLPVEVPVTLMRGEHTLEFVGLSAGHEFATVLIDAVSLKRLNTVRTEGVTSLYLSTGSTVILDNTSTLYLEYIYVDGVRLNGALRTGTAGGATVLGNGRILTKSGGTMIQIR
jgi:autotransporter-associated beta strand protein